MAIRNSTEILYFGTISTKVMSVKCPGGYSGTFRRGMIRVLFGILKVRFKVLFWSKHFDTYLVS